MWIQKVIGPGWVEVFLGGVLLPTSVMALVAGTMTASQAATDLLVLLALIANVKFSRVGVSLLSLGVALSLYADPNGVGITAYLLICGIVLKVRTARFLEGAIATVLLGLVVVLTSWNSLDRSDLLGPVVAFALMGLAGWVIGGGFRSVANAEAAKVASELRERQMAVAADLHDMVARNLAVAVLDLQEALSSDDVDESALTGVIARLRTANATLREQATTLRGGAPSSEVQPRFPVLLSRGLAELDRVSFEVETVGAELEELDRLPEDVDVVVGRIIGEALHNVVKHGDRRASCVVAVEITEDSVDLTVTNQFTNQHGPVEGASMGITMMRQHALAVGGRFEAGPAGKTWVCAASLPLQVRDLA